jgi:hypothetical protein
MSIKLNIGDSVYVDNNETFIVEKRTVGYALVGLSGETVAKFPHLAQIPHYLNSIYDTVEIIKNKTVSEKTKVEYSIITDELEYVDGFDDTIYMALQNIGKIKGMNIEKMYREGILTNEMLAEIRVFVVEYLNKVTDNTIDLSPPEKEYKLGDEVTVYYEDTVQNATIIWLSDEEKYGLLLYGEFTVEYSTANADCDSPTNYILWLQRNYGLNIE